MTTAVVTGYGRAVGVFDMDPEFPVRESNARRAVQTRQGAGVSHRRQDARSAGDVDFEAQVRSWTLEWSQATKTEADQLREYYRATRAGGAFLLYYPPRETGASNLCPFGESFDSTVWKRGTVDTALSADGTSLPAGVGGSAYLLENGGSATTPAFIFAQGGAYPSAGNVFAFSVYVQRPASNASGYATVLMYNPATNDTEYGIFSWSGSAWVSSSTSGDGVAQVATSGSWSRLLFGAAAGASNVSAFPSKRYLLIQSGTTANPEAAKGLLIAGAVLEEAKSISALSGTGGYVVGRKHVLVRITDNPLRIERWGPNQYRMSVTLMEEPVAP